jgi:hydroxypyruvate isomerase
MLKGQIHERTFMEAVAQIGFTAVELWGRDKAFPDFAENARSSGLRIASMVGHEHATPRDGGHAEGFSRERNHERLEAELRVSIDLAATFDIPGLIVLSGHRNPGESDIEALSVCVRGLRRIAPYAVEKGVNLNLEILNTTVDHPRYLCDRTDWAVAVCEQVACPRVKILFDVYHVQIMEGNVIHRLRKAAPWIGHYHLAGVPGRGVPDDTQELNYRGICRAIAGTGYEGYVGHEFRPGADPLRDLRYAYEVCGGEE